MIGVGLTPEGIEQNDVIYDFMMETIWYTSPVDLDKWVTNYAHRRYGFINQDIISAWHLLQVIFFLELFSKFIEKK
jgi:alpha-N-acetylglucosaminidase